jgi:hypothetical protein
VHRIVSLVLFGMSALQKDKTACLPSSHDSPAEPSISQPEADSCADVIPDRSFHSAGSATAHSADKAKAKATIHFTIFSPAQPLASRELR